MGPKIEIAFFIFFCFYFRIFLIKWEIKDEWYNYYNLNPDINVLLNLDESTYYGGTHGKKHPITWYHQFDGGRAFYTGLGHLAKTYSDQRFIKLLTGGILYASFAE